MTNLYIDLETLPANNQWLIDELNETTVNKKLSKPESIAEWERDKKPAAVEEARIKTAVDTSLANILCLGYAIDDNETEVLTGGEIDILRDFFSIYEGLKFPMLIGHNIVGFDLPLIYHRAVIHGIKVPGRFPKPSDKPWDVNANDTMQMWSGIRDRIKLDRLAKLLGAGSKGGISGADVYPMYKEGRVQEIYDYCKSDVSLTREVYQRIFKAVA